jgi:hypothetical protein
LVRVDYRDSVGNIQHGIDFKKRRQKMIFLGIAVGFFGTWGLVYGIGCLFSKFDVR